ncbi:uncharacterized protein LOC119397991 isoform X2 [Rhipicephalus sanguineus]|uniref:uncharacterized protein LOC119397991 isoform X2 n=1 Tax=Rhipicephalus sanguineus TaxID=34632 RepID=UPI001893B10C|nr:uncharacterized protein LOC119397991 isoform X2 [Rhipicephalus sanguineus]
MMLCYAFIAFTIDVATATFEYPGRATMNDVFEFFKTEQEILLYKRSYSRQIEKYDPVCIYNRVKEMSGSRIRLYQRYDYGTQSKHGCFAYGVSYNVSKQPGMDIAPIIEAKKTKEHKCTKAAYIENSKGLDEFEGDYKEGRTYLFQYYDATEKCAVITFSDKKRKNFA